MSTSAVKVPVARRAFTSTRLIGLAGLDSFILIVTAAFVSPPLWKAPGTMSSAARVAAYGQHNAGRIIASLLIYSLAMAMFLCFAGGLTEWLREREPAPQALSSVFGFAAVALATLVLAAFAPAYLLSYREQAPEIAAPLADLTFGLLALSGIPTAVCLGAYAVLVKRLHVLPVWTAWPAIIGALTHVVIAASFVSHGAFLSLEAPVIVWIPATFFAWIFCTSAVLIGRGVDRPSPTA